MIQHERRANDMVLLWETKQLVLQVKRVHASAWNVIDGTEGREPRLLSQHHSADSAVRSALEHLKNSTATQGKVKEELDNALWGNGIGAP